MGGGIGGLRYQVVFIEKGNHNWGKHIHLVSSYTPNVNVQPKRYKHFDRLS